MEANVSLSTRRALYFRADFFLRFASRFFLFNQNSLLYTVCLVPCRFHCRSNCWLRSRRLNFVDEIIILNLFSVAVMTSNEMQSREIATWQRFKFIKFPRLTWVGLRSFPAIKQIVNLRKVITRLSPALQIHRQLFIYNHCMFEGELSVSCCAFRIQLKRDQQVNPIWRGESKNSPKLCRHAKFDLLVAPSTSSQSSSFCKVTSKWLPRFIESNFAWNDANYRAAIN